MKSFLKSIFFSLPFGKIGRNRASILMYHSVSDRSDYFANVLPQEFEGQMQYLAREKFSVISLLELVRRLRAGESLGGAIILTFDDGYRDNYTDVFPVLKRFDFPATIFVTTDQIGSVDARGIKHLSIAEMKEIESSGLVSIEPHTKSHPKLGALLPKAAREEITGSKKVVENLLSKTATIFAYPYGNFNDDTLRIVKETGFDSAVTVKEGTVGPECDPFRLPRNSIDSSTTLPQFKGKVTRAVDYYASLKI